MGDKEGLGTGYSHLLENPVLFLLFSSQAKAEFSMLLNRMGDLDRCIVMEAYEGAAAQIDDDRIVTIKLGDPAPGPLYQQKFTTAVRHTKRHKYCRGNDITVCVILEDSDDYSRQHTICQQVYDDIKNAYRNHVYFDFYVMANEPLISGTGLGLPALIHVLKPIEGEDWTRYMFLVSDITNEERLVEQYAERFETVLDSIVLTNCRSSSGSSNSYIHERLLDESAELGNKILVLGRVRMELDEAAAKCIIRHEMLEFIQHLPVQPGFTSGRLNLEGLRFDILQDVEHTYPGILKVGLYEDQMRGADAQYTNQDIVSRYFQSGADAYMQFQQERLEEKFKKSMEHYCRYNVRTWLMDSLFQLSDGVIQKECCRAVFQEAVGEIQNYRELAQKASRENEQEYSRWQSITVKTSRWVRWVSRNRWYEKYRVLKEWVEFQGRRQAAAILEQCLQDMEFYAINWACRMDGRCELFSLLCLGAREDLEELLEDCCEAEQHLMQRYQEGIARELANMAAGIRDICSVMNNLLREDVDAEYLDRSIGRCVDWLYARRLKDIRLFGDQDTNTFGEMLANFEDHICLLTRTKVHNIAPYVFLMGRSGNAFLEYVRGQKNAKYIVFDTEYMECPAAFYYQHLC